MERIIMERKLVRLDQIVSTTITFLKSVEDENKAMELIKQEKSMYQVVLS